MKKFLTVVLCSLMPLFSSATILAQAPGKPAAVALALSPDGRLLAAGTELPDKSGALLCWELATSKLLWSQRQPRGCYALDFAPDSKTLAFAALDDMVRLLDCASGKEQSGLHVPGQTIRCIAFSHDGRSLATGCYDGSVKIWDRASLRQRQVFEGHKGRVFAVAFSPDDRYLASGGEQDARLWDTTSGTEKFHWPHGNLVRCVRFWPDGRWVVTGSWDNTVRVWNVASGEKRLQLLAGNVESLALASEASRIAVGNSAKTIPLFDLRLTPPTEAEQDQIRRLLGQLDDDDYTVRELATRAFYRIGMVAEPALRAALRDSSSAEVRLRARRIRRDILSRARTELVGHGGAVPAVVISRDGQFLVSGSKDGTVRLWDVQSGKETRRLSLEAASR
jgi:WD40 repeat protein